MRLFGARCLIARYTYLFKLFTSLHKYNAITHLLKIVKMIGKNNCSQEGAVTKRRLQSYMDKRKFAEKDFSFPLQKNNGPSLSNGCLS